MESKTVLLDLPNELFPLIFQYLSAIDLLKTFSDVKSTRIQTLITSLISRLDVSEESDEWIENYLSNILTQYEILHLRIQSNHLKIIAEHLSSTKVESMELVDFNACDDSQNQILDRLRKKLKKLSFIKPGTSEYNDLAALIFQSDSQLQNLTLVDYPLYFFGDVIQTMNRLTHLSIVLEGIDPLFKLMQHLPNLRNLKVKMFSQECIVQPPPETQGVKPCNELVSVTFRGWIKYFDHLESFFDTFGSTIEYLSMNIDHRYYVYDGKQLEKRILNKMPRLSSLDLIIFSPLTGYESIEIETFQSFTWQNLNPIVYWYDVFAKQHMIFTLPYKSDRFEYFSNEFASTCVSSRSVSLCFDRVHTLVLTNVKPFHRETFLFIEKVFPKIKTIQITTFIKNFEEEENENEEHQNRPIMDEDLLLDTDIQIPSVKELSIDLEFPYDDYKTFRRFLEIFPNLINLTLDTEESFIHAFLQDDDQFVKVTLGRIEYLNINFRHKSKSLTDEEIHRLFPKLKEFKKHYNQQSG